MDPEHARNGLRNIAASATIGARRALVRACRRVFRHYGLALVAFFSAFALMFFGLLLLPKSYVSEMKLIVERGPADFELSPDAPNSQELLPLTPIAEQDIGSAAELLRSRDLLERVVRASGLDLRKPSRYERIAEKINAALFARPQTHRAELSRILTNLQEHLSITPIAKTAVIRIRYSSPDPELSARVLRDLSAAFRNAPAALDTPNTDNFFDRQRRYFENQAAVAQAALADVESRQGTISPAVREQDVRVAVAALQRKHDEQEETIDATEARLVNLKSQEKSIPQREIAQMKSSGNAVLMSQLEARLIDRRMQHTDMVARHALNDPLLRDLESQIAGAEQAVSELRSEPLQEITTDRSPLRDPLEMEAAQASADDAAAVAAVSASEQLEKRYRQEIVRIAAAEAQDRRLRRDFKVAEDNYLLYTHAREQARIAEEFNASQGLRLRVVEQPVIPVDPALQLAWLMAGSLLLAAFCGVSAAYAADRLQPLAEKERGFDRYGNLRVLNSIPASGFER